MNVIPEELKQPVAEQEERLLDIGREFRIVVRKGNKDTNGSWTPDRYALDMFDATTGGWKEITNIPPFVEGGGLGGLGGRGPKQCIDHEDAVEYLNDYARCYMAWISQQDEEVVACWTMRRSVTVEVGVEDAEDDNG